MVQRKGLYMSQKDRVTADNYMLPPFNNAKLVEMLVRNDGIDRAVAEQKVATSSYKVNLLAVQDQMERYGDASHTLSALRVIGQQKAEAEAEANAAA